MSNGHIPACEGILGEGENHTSIALLDTDAQVTILPGPLEGGECEIPTDGVHSRDAKLKGPCGRVL